MLSIVMMSIIMLNIIMLSIVVLSVSMLSVVMVNSVMVIAVTKKKYEILTRLLPKPGVSMTVKLGKVGFPRNGP